MKTLFAFLFLSTGFSLQLSAGLIVRGTDSLGHRLIYDTDRDITWYDFTYRTSIRPDGGDDNNPNWGWHDAGQWAAALTVTLDGVTYSDWRLPSAGANPQSGYGQTTPEMGHLYYSELGNRPYPDPGWGLQNTGSFQHLTSYYCWSAERAAPGQDAAWVFAFSTGSHAGFGHTDLPYYALAVRAGDVVPELRLSIARVGSASAEITWATNFAGHVLEHAASLPAAGWSTVTNAATTIGGRRSVTVETGATQRVYRLRKP